MGLGPIEKQPVVECIGHGRTPIVTIDDYASSTERLITKAFESCDFSVDKNAYYPGVRAALPKEYVVACLKPLIDKLYSLYQIPKGLVPYSKGNYYSLITTQPKDLTPIQCFPHFDSANPFFIAVIHYLGEGEHGGTGFFRHTPSQYEFVNEPRKASYFGAVEKYINKLSGMELSYCTVLDEFECYKVIDYKPNRLIVFPGYLLHTTIVNVDTDVNPNPRTGRLTANMFIEFQ